MKGCDILNLHEIVVLCMKGFKIHIVDVFLRDILNLHEIVGQVHERVRYFEFT